MTSILSHNIEARDDVLPSYEETLGSKFLKDYRIVDRSQAEYLISICSHYYLFNVIPDLERIEENDIPIIRTAIDSFLNLKVTLYDKVFNDKTLYELIRDYNDIVAEYANPLIYIRYNTDLSLDEIRDQLKKYGENVLFRSEKFCGHNKKFLDAFMRVFREFSNLDDRANENSLYEGYYKKLLHSIFTDDIYRNDFNILFPTDINKRLAEKFQDIDSLPSNEVLNECLIMRYNLFFSFVRKNFENFGGLLCWYKTFHIDDDLLKPFQNFMRGYRQFLLAVPDDVNIGSDVLHFMNFSDKYDLSNDSIISNIMIKNIFESITVPKDTLENDKRTEHIKKSMDILFSVLNKRGYQLTDFQKELLGSLDNFDLQDRDGLQDRIDNIKNNFFNFYRIGGKEDWSEFNSMYTKLLAYNLCDTLLNSIRYKIPLDSLQELFRLHQSTLFTYIVEIGMIDRDSFVYLMSMLDKMYFAIRLKKYDAIKNSISNIRDSISLDIAFRREFKQ